SSGAHSGRKCLPADRSPAHAGTADGPAGASPGRGSAQGGRLAQAYRHDEHGAVAMKRIAALVMMALLAACSEPPPASVITVSEFLADENLRADHIGKCRENPGELRQTPNCRNA